MTPNLDEKSVSAAVCRIDKWVSKNGWAGWDPYDLRENEIYTKIGKMGDSFPKNLVKRLLDFAVDFHPISVRRILGIKPKINAKAMGLFLTSYANLYRYKRRNYYLDRATECADWLIKNANQKYSGMNWGYPFDWQSVQFIPKHTPSSVVTAIVGDGFFRIFKLTQNERYLDICLDICRFFTDNLNSTYQSEKAHCYSYTPIDNYQVHNANLFVGEYLTRIGREISDGRLVDLGIRCGNFALKEQQEDGFLPYWGLAQTHSHSRGKIRVDHYHSGFEIRMLYNLWRNTGKVVYRNSCIRYYKWYIQNMFNNDYIPNLKPDGFYPVNIHACAESVLCQASLLPEFSERIQFLNKTIQWIIANMEYAPGKYTYLIKQTPIIGKKKVKIPMVRWGQAWMMRALTEVLVQTDKFTNNSESENVACTLA